MKTPIKLAILDDHKNQLEGLQAILEKESDIEVLVTSHSWETFKSQVKDKTIDIAVLDIHLSKQEDVEDGIDIAQYFQYTQPEMKCILLSLSATCEEIRRAKKANVHGYLLKEESTKELLKAIRIVHSQKMVYFSQKVVNIMIACEKEPEIHFTDREIEILKYISMGNNVPRIKKLTGRSDAVIKTHKKNVMKKLGINNVEALVAWGIEHGYHKL